MERQNVKARPTEDVIFTAGDAEDENAVADGEELHAEELESRKALPTPTLPSQDVIDEHWLDHLQYRSWCGCCVNGRGRERPHLRTHGKRKIPTLGFDYCFASKDGIYSREEWKNMPEGTKGVKIIVARELVSKATFAHVVQNKGLGEDGFAAACLVKDVEWLGFTRMMLRSDNEPAIVALLKESLKEMRIQNEDLEQIGEEHPPERDPQANGAIENAVGAFKGLMRTQVLALESRLGHRIPPEHPIVAWLAQHATFGLTTRIKGDDGKTAYERVRMRPFSTRMLEFGELCRHKLDTREAQQNGTFAARWGQGIFVGIDKMTGRYVIWDGEKVVQARSVQRMPDCQKWNKDKVASVALRPQQLHEPREPRVRFRDQEHVVDVPKGEEPQRLARRLYIKASDIEAFGYTEGCPKCDNDLKYGFGRTSKGHSNACRTRITKELAKTDSGRERIAAASGRLDNFLS